MARGEEADEVAHRFDVLFVAVELFGFLAGRRPAIARAHRVDEDQIRAIQQAELVVDQPVGRWHKLVHIARMHTARPQQAHVHPDRRRARAAVEGESERLLARFVNALAQVGDIEDRRPVLAFVVLEHHGPGDGLVGDCLAVDGDGLFGFAGLFGQWGFGL